MVNLNDMRKQYKMAELNRSDLLESPTNMFRNWFEKVENLENIETNAMTLATATKKGEPSSRIVLLKDYDERGFVFYTNYNSEKGNQIEQNPYGSLTFHWNQLEQQVRIRGKIRKISIKHSKNSDLFLGKGAFCGMVNLRKGCRKWNRKRTSNCRSLDP